MKESNVCPVCWRPLSSLDWGVIVPCGHAFHRQCFTEWNRLQCPTCNRDVERFQDVHLSSCSMACAGDDDDDDDGGVNPQRIPLDEDYDDVFGQLQDLSTQLMEKEEELKELRTCQKRLWKKNAKLKKANEELREQNTRLEKSQGNIQDVLSKLVLGKVQMVKAMKTLRNDLEKRRNDVVLMETANPELVDMYRRSQEEAAAAAANEQDGLSS